MATKKKAARKKLTGAKKAAFLKRMAAGRKAAKKSAPKKRKNAAAKPATKKRAKKVARKAVRKTVKRKSVAARKVVRKPAKKKNAADLADRLKAKRVIRKIYKRSPLSGWGKKDSGRKRKPNAAKKRAAPKKRIKNGDAKAAAFYRETHGRDPERNYTVTEKLKEHSVLSGLGKLKKLVVRSYNGGAVVDIEGFRGALLASNTTGTQLYIKGGDQAVNVADFGIRTKHESEVLGQLVQIEYETTKDHLGNEGGHADYFHKFEQPLPVVNYDVRNRLLSISGGVYKLRDVGIVR